jgi:hypothetical protein
MPAHTPGYQDRLLTGFVRLGAHAAELRAPLVSFNKIIAEHSARILPEADKLRAAILDGFTEQGKGDRAHQFQAFVRILRATVESGILVDDELVRNLISIARDSRKVV